MIIPKEHLSPELYQLYFRVFNFRPNLCRKEIIFLFDINCSFVGRPGVSVFMSCRLCSCVCFAFPA